MLVRMGFKLKWTDEARPIVASYVILVSFGIVLGVLDGFDTVSRMVVRYDESRWAFFACSFVIVALQLGWLHKRWDEQSSPPPFSALCVKLGAVLASAGLILAAAIRVDTDESTHVLFATFAFAGIFLFQLGVWTSIRKQASSSSARVQLSNTDAAEGPRPGWCTNMRFLIPAAFFWLVGAVCAALLVPDSIDSRAPLEYAVITLLHLCALAMPVAELH